MVRQKRDETSDLITKIHRPKIRGEEVRKNEIENEMVNETRNRRNINLGASSINAEK